METFQNSLFIEENKIQIFKLQIQKKDVQRTSFHLFTNPDYKPSFFFNSFGTASL